MPLDMFRELRSLLGEHEFSFQPVIWRTGVYEALLRIEPGPDENALSMAPLLIPFAQSSFFDSAKSGAWQLPCCWDAVKWNVPLWLACFRSSDDNVILGETVLGKRLLDEIHDAAEGM